MNKSTDRHAPNEKNSGDIQNNETNIYTGKTGSDDLSDAQKWKITKLVVLILITVGSLIVFGFLLGKII